MEVHHHPHVEKKNFKEYFLEFLMIFLAVTMGFFAEQIREHFADKARVKEYMEEITENLAYDTVRCTTNLKSNIESLPKFDSFRVELKEAIRGNVNANKLYYYIFFTNNISRAVFNTAAITELKSSGSLRLLANKKILDELSDYYERKTYATNVYLPSITSVETLQNKIFSLINLDDYVDAYDNISAKTYDVEYDYESILNHTPVLTLLNHEPVLLAEYYTQVSLLEIQIKRYDFWLAYTKKAATKLIADIKNEYGFKNE